MNGAAPSPDAWPNVPVVTPQSYVWPNFLKADNLLNIANQIAVIAILAIGMTLVIITGGIDLSVGSLIALSAVVTARLIRDVAGGRIGRAGGDGARRPARGSSSVRVVGLFSGTMVTLFRIPPFIVTLAMMLVGSGLAYILADGQSINQVPERSSGSAAAPTCSDPERRRADAGALRAGARADDAHGHRPLHLRRGRQRRGGPALRRAGPPGAAPGLLALRRRSPAWAASSWPRSSRAARPTYGQMYELYVIAAVVVGGTSLAGGEGRILGTLIGAFIIAVIQNGMNLLGVESYTQKIVLGLVILGAVLLDRLKTAVVVRGLATLLRSVANPPSSLRSASPGPTMGRLPSRTTRRAYRMNKPLAHSGPTNHRPLRRARLVVQPVDDYLHRPHLYHAGPGRHATRTST